jgi:hypothetical protein
MDRQALSEDQGQQPDSPIAADEEILWRGRPGWRMKLSMLDGTLIVGAIGWLLVAPRIMHELLRQRCVYTDFFIAVMILILLLLFQLTIGYFLLGFVRRRTTEYVVTNRRVLIRGGVLITKVQNYSWGMLGKCYLYENRNGSGFIVFGPENSEYIDLRDHPLKFMRTLLKGEALIPALEAIKDVRKVHDLIVAQQKKYDDLAIQSGGKVTAHSVVSP